MPDLSDLFDAYWRFARSEQVRRRRMRDPLPDTSAWYAQGDRALGEEMHWILEGKYREQAAFCAERLKRHGLDSVLELGCGSGLFARELLALAPGLDYTGLDACEAFLAMARRRNKGVDFLHRDLREWRGRHEQPYGLVVLWNVLKNVGLHEWDRVLRHCLSLGGHAAFNLQGWEFDDLDNGADYHHVVLSEGHLLAAVVTAGHEVVERDETGSAELDGKRMREWTLWTRQVPPS